MDTHVWVWAAEDEKRLGKKTRAMLQDPSTERYVCAVSALEIARLVWSGDLTLQMSLKDWASVSLQDLQTDILPATLEIAIEAYNLPEPFHRDPADRQIIACARTQGLTLVTADQRILDWKHVSSFDARK